MISFGRRIRFSSIHKFILPFIGSFRDKRTYKISMGTMYFHCICSRLFRPQSRISVSLDQLVQFFRRNCFWDFCLHRGRNTFADFNGYPVTLGVSLNAMLKLNGNMPLSYDRPETASLKLLTVSSENRHGFPQDIPLYTRPTDNPLLQM